MRNANRYFSAFLASLFLVSLVPTPTGGALLGENQEQDLVAKYGPGAPFGTVGKMLEEVDLFLHSEELAAAGTDYPTRIVESITAGGDPANTGYQQLAVPVANFRQPEATLSSMYHVVPAEGAGGCAQGFLGDPGQPCNVQFLSDDPNDAANKRVRIGYLDPAGYAPEPQVGGEPDFGLPDPGVVGADFYQSVSYLTPPEMAAQEDFRIYDLKVDAYAICGITDNRLGQFVPQTPASYNSAAVLTGGPSFGDLIVNVYRVDAGGNRLLDRNDDVASNDGVSVPLVTVRSNIQTDQAQPVAADRYQGSYLEVGAGGVPGASITPRPIPNFFRDEGRLVKQGERLEFEFGLDYATSVWVNSAPGEGQIFGATEDETTYQEFFPYDIQCFLHFDTLRDENAPAVTGQPAPDVYAMAANDPAQPVQSLRFPGRGYQSKVTVIADTLRASTWMSDTNDRLASGMGNGDTFNVNTVYASAWGTLAEPENLEDQPKALNNRVLSRFRQLDTLEEVKFGDPIAGPFFDNPSDSILTTKTTYSFAAGTKALSAHGNELYIRDPSFDISAITAANKRPLVLRTQSFEGAVIAVSPPVAIGKTGMDFALADDEQAIHVVNPGEPTIFTYKVSNLGSSADTLTIVADAIGGGWTIQVLNSRQQIGGGGTALVNVLVTPPATAQAGSLSPPIKVRAISTFADIIAPKQAQDVFVSVVSTVTRGVNLTSTTPEASLTPNGIRLIGVSVRNEGTAAESIILTATVPSDIAGWSIKVLPTAKQVAAGGRADFQIELRAPNNAPANLRFPLTVVAAVVGAGVAEDILSIPIKVVGDTGLVVTYFPGDRQIEMRRWGGTQEAGPLVTHYNTRDILGPDVEGTPAEQIGQQCIGVPDDDTAPNPAEPEQRCVVTDQDPSYTDSILVPILLENTGTLADTYTVRRTHTALPTGNGCYRYRIGESGLLDSAVFATTTTASFKFDVPAGKSKVVVLEISCPRTSASDAAMSAGAVNLGLTFASTASATLLRGPSSVKLVPQDPGAFRAVGEYDASIHAVDARFDDDQSETASVLRTQAARYLIRAQNVGNERDDLTIRLNTPPSGSGWTQTVSLVNSSRGGDLGYCAAVPSAGGLEVRCSGAVLSAANQPDTRAGLRVGEEVLLAVDVTPGAFVPLGSTFRTVIAVASTADGSKTDILETVTTATGTFVFDVVSRASSLTVEKGGQATLPFAIRNLGTSGDDYSVGLISGNADFKPRLSVPDESFVPGGSVLHGFLTITAPATATVGQQVPFRIQVASNGTPLIGFVDLTATVVEPSNLRVVGVPSSVLVEQRGVDQAFQVKVTDLLARSGTSVNVTTDQSRLPAGWNVTSKGGNASVPLFNTTVPVLLTTQADGTVSGIANFTVRAPATDLGVSRIPLRFTAGGGSELGFSDIVFDLTSIAALSISAPDGASGIATAGSDFVYSLRVKNAGTGNDLVTMSATGVPTGWTVSFNPAQTTLGPLEEQTVDMTVTAPQGATPRTVAPIVAFATGASGAVAQRLITTTIGYLDLAVSRSGSATGLASPQEAASFVVNVTNTGTLTNDIGVTLDLVSTQYASQITLTALPSLLEDVRPGESRDVLVRAVLGESPPAAARISFTASAKFVSAAAPAAQINEMAVEVYDYKAADADGDGIQEYAVDKDRVANGYEAFVESNSPSGKGTVSLDMSRYLSNASLEKFLVDVPQADGNVTRVVRFALDGDNDGRVDHFLDSDGNLVPDRYWDPDSGVVSVINTTKDVNGDDIPELFVDLTGDGRFDAVYDLDQGAWTNVRILDLDGDAVEDYYVDSDGDNRLDADETVLYTKTGKLLTVQKIDLDGDDSLDSVFDSDGDGRADYFIVNGSSESIPIQYRDVTRDGVLDWTYDLDGNGDEESYYDPTSGEVHLIDNEAGFYAALRDHWYIGALFGLVVLLFIVLLAVTRR